MSRLLDIGRARALDTDADGHTALHMAAHNGSEAVFRAIVRHSLLELYDEYEAGARELSSRLREIRARVKSEVDSILAGEWADEERIRLRRTFITDSHRVVSSLLSARDAKGCTPLHYAAAGGRGAVVGERQIRTLLSCGGPISAELLEGGRRAHLSSSSSSSSSSRGRHLSRSSLSSLRRCVNVCDDDGSTPLHYACAAGNAGAVRALVDFGADKALVSEFGEVSTILPLSASLCPSLSLLSLTHSLLSLSLCLSPSLFSLSKPSFVKTPMDLCPDRHTAEALMGVAEAVKRACEATTVHGMAFNTVLSR